MLSMRIKTPWFSEAVYLLALFDQRYELGGFLLVLFTDGNWITNKTRVSYRGQRISLAWDPGPSF